MGLTAAMYSSTFIQKPYTGAEPVATALSFTLVLVHLHPEEGLRPLMAEIDEVLGKRSKITLEDIEKLKYTEQVNYIFNYIISAFHLVVYFTGTGCSRGHEDVLSSNSNS